jgi:ABC-type branched-subunit amino acid transport system substrate-binding protein
MKIIAQLIAATFLFLLDVNLTFADENPIRVGVIEDLSGPRAVRGVYFVDLYKKNIDAINQNGGLQLRQGKRKVELIIADSSSTSAIAAEKIQRLLAVDKVVVTLCSSNGCRAMPKGYSTPLILTTPSIALTDKTAGSVFLINAPSAEDYETQATLAFVALREALLASEDASAVKIAVALRKLNLTTNFGQIRFDAMGNNVGLVPYPFRSMFKPDAAGCTSSCGSACPSNCGQTPCEKSGSNQCCNICGMPNSK